MTEADFEGGPSSTSQPIRLDLYLNIALAALLLAILGGAAYFGWSVYRDQQNELASSATGRLVAVLSAQIRKSPNDAIIRVRLGEALGAMGRYPEAIEQLNAALKIDPKHTGAYLDLGMIAVLTKNPDAAERYFQKVIAITDSAEYASLSTVREQAFYNLGLLTLDQKRYAEAAGFFKGALQLRKDASDSYFQLAHAYQGLGDTNAAIQQLETGLQFDPGFAEAHYYLGTLYQQQHDDYRAVLNFTDAVQLAPGADPPRQALDAYGSASDWLTKAQQSMTANDLDAAALDAKIAGLLDASSFDAAKLLGQILLQQGDLRGALAAFTQAGKINPNDAGVKAQIATLTKQVAALTPAKTAANKAAAARRTAARRKAAAKKAPAK